jgi:hypothetical protein
MQCVVCGNKRMDSRSLTCYNRKCQHVFYEKKLYKINMNKNKQRKKLVKLLTFGCSKDGICFILGISMQKLNHLLAKTRTCPTEQTNRL